jgi:anti-sigma factor RsiW
MTRAQLIQRYFDGELPPDARRHVDRTMSASEREELADFATIRVLLRGWFAGGARSASETPDGTPSFGVDAAGAELEVASGRSAQRHGRRNDRGSG